MDETNKTKNVKAIVFGILAIFFFLCMLAEGAAVYYFYQQQDVRAEKTIIALKKANNEIDDLNKKVEYLNAELDSYSVENREVPVITENDSFMLKAGDVATIHFTIPANTVKVIIEAKVIQGNPLNFYLLSSEREEMAFLNKETFYNRSEAKQLGVKEYIYETDDFRNGEFYLGLSDPTMGIISSSTNSIFYKITCVKHESVIVKK